MSQNAVFLIFASFAKYSFTGVELTVFLLSQKEDSFPCFPNYSFAFFAKYSSSRLQTTVLLVSQNTVKLISQNTVL